jgi:hypothetical protein
MALVLAHLNDALRKAGVDDDTARKAAEEVAGFENRLSKVEADLGLLKWMVGANITLTFALLPIVLGTLWQVVNLASRIP